MEYPVLIRVKDKSLKIIKETPFYVGFNPACDMTVNNSALNDVHFRIDLLEDRYVVLEDRVTRNYTSVDDDYAIGYNEITLKDKSIIRAANELFIFVKGDGDFTPEAKNDKKRILIGRTMIKSKKIRKIPEVSEDFRVAEADKAFMSFMNNECINDVVFFAYERPYQGYESKKIVVCVSTEGQKGFIKRLRDVCGKTDKISNVEVTSLKMADDCEIEILDNLGNKIANEAFCWTGLVFCKEFEVSASTTELLINLKSFDKTVGSIKIEL